MRKGFLLLLAGLAMLATPIFASIDIDFGGSGGGTITETVSGTTITVVGNNIEIDAMSVGGDGGYDGKYAISSGVLDFSFTGNPSSGATTLTLSGNIGTCTVINPGDCSTSLNNTVSGTLLTGNSPDQFSFTGGGGAVGIDVSILGSDTKSASLLSALGISGLDFAIGLGGSLAGQTSSSTSPYVYTNTSSDIANESVPEPTSVLLLGTILAGVAILVRRRTATL
jgi:hypothetical protein